MSHGERASRLANRRKEFWGIARRSQRGGVELTWIPRKLAEWFTRARRRREDKAAIAARREEPS